VRLLAGILVVLAVLSVLAALAGRGRSHGPDRPPSGRGLVNGLLLLGAFVLGVFAVVVLRQG